MITPNNTSNRSREKSLLTNVAHCDAVNCERTITLRPQSEEQATLLSTGAAPTGWVKTFLTSRNWTVDGVETYCQKHPFGATDEDAEIILDDEVEDQIKTFLDEATIPNPEGRTVYSELWDEYREWAKENGTLAVGKRKFGDALRADGLTMKTVSLRVGERGRKAVRSFYCVMGITRKGASDYEPPETRIARLEMENLELREAIAQFTARQENQNK